MENTYNVGDIIKVKVSGIEKYGIFVHVDDLYNGLIHISEISSGFIPDINDIVKFGEEIYCLVTDVDTKTHQLKLSIKNINYKNKIDPELIQETRLGFLPLKSKLDEWINDKLKEIK
ncbi:MAG: S1 RNA-binding domain-containing protein [Bacilli bacterium]